MKKLWNELVRLVRWYKQWRLKGMNITPATPPVKVHCRAGKIYDARFAGPDANMTRDEFIAEFETVNNPRSTRDELRDIVLDKQLDRARAFGQDHRRKRSKQ